MSLAVGDSIVFTKNYRKHGLINGEEAKVLSAGYNRNGVPYVRVQLTDYEGNPSQKRWIPKEYLLEGNIEHSYCATTDSKQGGSIEYVLYAGASTRDFEEANTAASRASLRFTVFLADGVRDDALSAYFRSSLQHPALAHMTEEQYEAGLAEWQAEHPPGQLPLTNSAQYWRAVLHRAKHDQLAQAKNQQRHHDRDR